MEDSQYGVWLRWEPENGVGLYGEPDNVRLAMEDSQYTGR